MGFIATIAAQKNIGTPDRSTDRSQDWERHFDELHMRIADSFLRIEARRRSKSYLKALIETQEQTAAFARLNDGLDGEDPRPRRASKVIGQDSPDQMQRLLYAADWDANAVRDELRNYVVEHIAHNGGVLSLGEVRFVKKGSKSAGVQQLSGGRGGRTINCQTGLFLFYGGRTGSGFIDRELFLPEEWTDDWDRRNEAGVPDTLTHGSKADLARDMILRALSARVPCQWVTGNETYGSDHKLRITLERLCQGYVLAIPGSENVQLTGGRYDRADDMATDCDPRLWKRHASGNTRKGARLYEWALIPIVHEAPLDKGECYEHSLLVRRGLNDHTDRSYYVVYDPTGANSLEAAIRVAGVRWAMEREMEAARKECGLDRYEVRKWDSWYRHITLSLLAHAFRMAMVSAAIPDDRTPLRLVS